jgi:hypothetical protein
MENRYSPLRRPLSARRERPQGWRTPEQTDQLAPPHMPPRQKTALKSIYR